MEGSLFSKLGWVALPSGDHGKIRFFLNRRGLANAKTRLSKHAVGKNLPFGNGLLNMLSGFEELVNPLLRLFMLAVLAGLL